ncbi:hypothetical protein AB0B28_08080 [Glycomyces sp. NPDC046736]|uniref:hypothetical protein n=1 Tax=Glycomyces sp. NPDC046736 TaxID=3155615 RepID=UPI0033FD801C
MQQAFNLVRRFLTLIPKRFRGTVFAVVVLGMITLAVLDAYGVGPAGGLVDHVARVAAIAAGVIALANLRDPGEEPPDAE